LLFVVVALVVVVCSCCGDVILFGSSDDSGIPDVFRREPQEKQPEDVIQQVVVRELEDGEVGEVVEVVEIDEVIVPSEEDVKEVQKDQPQQPQQQPQQQQQQQVQDTLSGFDFWTNGGHAIQIVKPNADHTSLEVVEENLRILSRVPTNSEGVSVISVVGPYHSGKSFLLNQLVEMHGSKPAFKIGPTVNPETLGIWAFVPKNKLDGKTVIVLDTEGFFGTGATEEYDAKLFAVSTLVSSLMLYNSIKVIDQSQIDYLELLSRRTQLFALKTEKHSQDYLSFPHIVWLVRDFVQDLNNKDAGTWLKTLLENRSRFSLANATQNLAQSSDTLEETSLLNLFPSMECHTMFLPSTTKESLRHLDEVPVEQLTEDFRVNLEELKRLIVVKTPAKKQGSELIQPDKLTSLIKVLIDAVNSGSFPKVSLSLTKRTPPF